MTMSSKSETTADFDLPMQANLKRVFGERNVERRTEAIRELYTADAELFEPGSVAAGHAAISDAVTALLSSLPANFAFASIGPAIGHHGLGRLRWQAGPPNGPAAVKGMDVARFEGGKIRTLHVFIEPASV
jgi:hypothetical protein